MIEVVAEKSGWAKQKPEKGRALGFAAHRSFLSYVAAVVDVEVDDQGRISHPARGCGGGCGPGDASGTGAGAVRRRSGVRRRALP